MTQTLHSYVQNIDWDIYTNSAILFKAKDKFPAFCTSVTPSTQSSCDSFQGGMNVYLLNSHVIVCANLSHKTCKTSVDKYNGPFASLKSN